ncbi:MAG: squalene--hopene cyclase [Planctomycetaceae bacterium]
MKLVCVRRITRAMCPKAAEAFLGISLFVSLPPSLLAQPPSTRMGEAIPRDVREVYDRGMQYLAKTQTEGGDWGAGGNDSGAGVTGMGVMVFLASGEDPNFGVYSGNIRRGLRSMIRSQNATTGYLGNSMYHHGFGMLALAEAYGAVDERNLWREADGRQAKQRSIGQSLELAVRLAVTSQKKNSLGAWRYGPDAQDADTSVSGAVLVGLLAARNAGIEVPDDAINRGISYYQKMTSASGQVAYSGLGFDDSLARVSIATLVYSIAHRKDLPQFQATIDFLAKNADSANSGHGGAEYQRYYQAQALLQGDMEAWGKWNQKLIRQIKQAQQADGSIQGQFGGAVGTSLSLLALAVNYRFLPIYER